MKARRYKAQMEMFVADVEAHPLGKKREKAVVYSAVCYLRQHDYRVFRVSGHQHNVNGRFVGTPQLKALAARIGWSSSCP